MIEIEISKGLFLNSLIKLNNVSSLNEGWQYINKYAEICCLARGYDEYGICEFREGRAYVSVVYCINNEVKASCTFDISEFERFSDFKTNNPYQEFVFTKVGNKYRPQQPVLTQKDIKKLLKKEPDLRDYGLLVRRKADASILPDPMQVQICIDWLKTKILKPTKTVSFNSSNIKCRIEQELKTYVTDGAVVAAIIYLGVPYERVQDSPKVEVFLLKKEIFCKPRG